MDKLASMKCLHSISYHSVIFYRKSMKFGIQEELLHVLNFLDTKFHCLPEQNIGMTRIKRMYLIKIILWESVCF